MTPERFAEVVEEQLKLCQAILCKKEVEYSQGKDRLDQFKRASDFTGKHPVEIAAMFMLKHTTSIYDCVEKESKRYPVSIEMWEEKITDHINYLLLIKAIIIEGKEAQDDIRSLSNCSSTNSNLPGSGIQPYVPDFRFVR